MLLFDSFVGCLNEFEIYYFLKKVVDKVYGSVII